MASCWIVSHTDHPEDEQGPHPLAEGAKRPFWGLTLPSDLGQVYTSSICWHSNTSNLYQERFPSMDTVIRQSRPLYQHSLFWLMAHPKQNKLYWQKCRSSGIAVSTYIVSASSQMELAPFPSTTKRTMHAAV